MSNSKPISGRDPRGRFGPGNSGGPGRPRRATEATYLRILADTVTLADWHDIVARAVTDAKAGDSRAREWLSRHVIGAEPMTLAALAVWDELGVSDEHVTRAEARHQTDDPLLRAVDLATPLQRAIAIREEEGRAAIRAGAAAELARRRAARREKQSDTEEAK